MQGGLNGGSHALLFGSRCEPYSNSKYMVEDERSYTYSTSMLSVMITPRHGNIFACRHLGGPYGLLSCLIGHMLKGSWLSSPVLSYSSVSWAFMNFWALPCNSTTNFLSTFHNLNPTPTITWSNFYSSLPPCIYVSHDTGGHMNATSSSLTWPCATCIDRRVTPWVYVMFASGYSFWISKVICQCWQTTSISLYTQSHDIRLENDYDSYTLCMCNAPCIAGLLIN